MKPAVLRPPRGGSRIRSTATARKSPGTPATKNAACQPCRWATAPLTKKLSASPTGNPIMKIDIASARRLAGTRSPMSELEVGAQVASPMPTQSRKANSHQNPVANPERKVVALHSATPAASSHRRFHRSAIRPSGNPITA